ncbi:predicted protein [Brucella abortus bv. 4 str. 292]|uniref:Uncharacterized protein n=12 Tax=Brucella TaxID=234 RepID=Q2YM79_BRUA2|nr:hypothetical protein BR1267 [Brucella suis 1330]AAX74607.1 hypothetical protein BruAb1_1269 [Brucella abortus bv. 1 str. 9-941]ACU48249.1 hypothetical protein BMI_I1278 [Brucella microti CCM 4915]AEK54581.1 hypothetical protein BPI_I1317 [Brucella pinnipedialis B2/94]AEU06271.1 hypothetical protein BSVBI22_A1263 [Brucella suis VBI22]AHN46890.1 hypothetical protein BSS2_I1234 [Brucella suis bv. 1 str. S2]EEP63193.1 Hypothetical protein, conserved [Brucella abortus str. 2308 A]EEX55476.1 pr
MVRSHHQIRCSMSFVKPIIDQTEVKDMTLPKRLAAIFQLDRWLSILEMPLKITMKA